MASAFSHRTLSRYQDEATDTLESMDNWLDTDYCEIDLHSFLRTELEPAHVPEHAGRGQKMLAEAEKFFYDHDDVDGENAFRWHHLRQTEIMAFYLYTLERPVPLYSRVNMALASAKRNLDTLRMYAPIIKPMIQGMRRAAAACVLATESSDLRHKAGENPNAVIWIHPEGTEPRVRLGGITTKESPEESTDPNRLYQRIQRVPEFLYRGVDLKNDTLQEIYANPQLITSKRSNKTFYSFTSTTQHYDLALGFTGDVGNSGRKEHKGIVYKFHLLGKPGSCPNQKKPLVMRLGPLTAHPDEDEFLFEPPFTAKYLGSYTHDGQVLIIDMEIVPHSEHSKPYLSPSRGQPGLAFQQPNTVNCRMSVVGGYPIDGPPKYPVIAKASGNIIVYSGQFNGQPDRAIDTRLPIQAIIPSAGMVMYVLTTEGRVAGVDVGTSHVYPTYVPTKGKVCCLCLTENRDYFIYGIETVAPPYVFIQANTPDGHMALSVLSHGFGGPVQHICQPKWKMNRESVFVTGCVDGSVMVWSLVTLQPIVHLHKAGQGSPVTAMRASAHGRYLYAGFANGEVKAWDLDQVKGPPTGPNGAALPPLSSIKLWGRITAITSPVEAEEEAGDARYVAGTSTGSIHIVKWERIKEHADAGISGFIEHLDVHLKDVTVLWLGEGKKLYSGSADGTFRQWDLLPLWKSLPKPQPKAGARVADKVAGEEKTKGKRKHKICQKWLSGNCAKPNCFNAHGVHEVADEPLVQYFREWKNSKDGKYPEPPKLVPPVSKIAKPQGIGGASGEPPSGQPDVKHSVWGDKQIFPQPQHIPIGTPQQHQHQILQPPPAHQHPHHFPQPSILQPPPTLAQPPAQAHAQPAPPPLNQYPQTVGVGNVIGTQNGLVPSQLNHNYAPQAHGGQYYHGPQPGAPGFTGHAPAPYTPQYGPNNYAPYQYNAPTGYGTTPQHPTAQQYGAMYSDPSKDPSFEQFFLGQDQGNRYPNTTMWQAVQQPQASPPQSPHGNLTLDQLSLMNLQQK